MSKTSVMKIPQLPKRVKRWISYIKRKTGPIIAHMPLTISGTLVFAASLIAFFYYGVKRLDHLLLVVGGVGILLVIVGFLGSSMAAILLYRKREEFGNTKLTTIESSYSSRSGFSVPALRWIPFVNIQWRWISPKAEVKTILRDGHWLEDVRPTRRGVSPHIVRRMEIGDVFGFTRIVRDLTEECGIKIVPSMGKLTQMHVVQGMASGEDLSHPSGRATGDRIDMRHYAPGDPIRFILWKIFAKTREVMIRTPERALSPVDQTVAYLVTGDGDEPAAGAARVAVDAGVLGNEWALGADGVGDIARTMPGALDLLARSASTSSENAGSGLSAFLTTANNTGMNGRAVVFVPASPGPWLDRVITATQNSETALSNIEFIVCTDGIIPEEKSSRLNKLMKPKNIDAARTDPKRLAEVLTVLRASPSSVLLIDREAGRVFHPAQLEKFTS